MNAQRGFMQQHYDAVIIGAGMSGLAAGIRLAMFDKRVLIVERHNAVGGLNSFYSIAGRKYDVGLHAMTNYVPRGTRGAPLTKLLRQLRIPHEAFDLSPQVRSRIAFAGQELTFTNDFAHFEAQVAEAFPAQIDGFRKFTAYLREFDETALEREEVSARDVIAHYLHDPRLIDMLMLPLCYYGSARQNDMDFSQFAIMFRALFFEGFARPFAGVRQVLRVLRERYRECGGQRRMKCGVRRIQARQGRATALELDDGSTLTADNVLSSIGWAETLCLCSDQPDQPAPDKLGPLSFTETLTVLDRQPAELDWKDTIIFFNTAERFHYEAPTELVDPRSGVICLPNNYQYAKDQQLDEGWLRVTALAHPEHWHALYPNQGTENPAYTQAKAHWYAELQRVALGVLPGTVTLPQLEAATLATDMFTPPTITKFTGHPRGAIYGSPVKNKAGRTHLENLYLCGTDQGFLGITGAMLSGISMANAHLL